MWCWRGRLGTVRNTVGTVGTVGTNPLELLGVTPNMRSLRSLQSLQCFARSLGGPYKNVHVYHTVSLALPCRCSASCARHVKWRIKLTIRKTCKPTMVWLRSTCCLSSALWCWVYCWTDGHFHRKPSNANVSTAIMHSGEFCSNTTTTP